MKKLALQLSHLSVLLLEVYFRGSWLKNWSKKCYPWNNFGFLNIWCLSAIKLTPDDARIPSYLWMLLCRCGVRYGVSGVAVASIYYIEFLRKELVALCSS